MNEPEGLYNPKDVIPLMLEDGAIVYEAQRLVESESKVIDLDNYKELWLPVSVPVASFDTAMGVIDWIKTTEPDKDYIFRVVEITIKRRIIWPEV